MNYKFKDKLKKNTNDFVHKKEMHVKVCYKWLQILKMYKEETFFFEKSFTLLRSKWNDLFKN